MMSGLLQWRVRDRSRLLFFLMNELAGAAHISFEGVLPRSILEYPSVSARETAILKRSTLRPLQDFAIIPMELSAIPDIVTAMGGTIPRSILHIQIEKDGKLAFAAYDNFHPESIFLGDLISTEFLERLVSNKSIARQ